MSRIRIYGDTSGYIEIKAPSVASNTTITIPEGGFAPSACPTFTGVVTMPATTSIGNVSSTEIEYLDGVTSGIQSQLNDKANSASVQSQLDAKEKSIPLQSSEPSSPSSSDLWVDSSGAAPILKVYNGSSWISLASPADDDQNILANRVFV